MSNGRDKDKDRDRQKEIKDGEPNPLQQRRGWKRGRLPFGIERLDRGQGRDGVYIERPGVVT